MPGRDLVNCSPEREGMYTETFGSVFGICTVLRGVAAGEGERFELARDSSEGRAPEVDARLTEVPSGWGYSANFSPLALENNEISMPRRQGIAAVMLASSRRAIATLKVLMVARDVCQSEKKIRRRRPEFERRCKIEKAASDRVKASNQEAVQAGS
jgi:hypothetical protein